MKYLANQKLWKVIRQPNGYYYEIKLGGMVIDRVKVEEPALSLLKKEEVINETTKTGEIAVSHGICTWCGYNANGPIGEENIGGESKRMEVENETQE